jgi:AraC-type DNA-binding domain-containing proteins
MKKRLQIIYLLSLIQLFYVVTIQANTEDSLRNVISNTEGAEKLKALASLTNLKLQGKDGLDHVILFEEEARKQNDEKYIGEALAVKAVIYANQYNSEKFHPAAEEAMDYLLKRKTFLLYFRLYSIVIKMYLLEGYYETAFLKISSMLEDSKKHNYVFGEICAFENMGEAYYIEKNFQKALESYREVYSLLSTNNPEQFLFRMETGLNIITSANKIGDMHLVIIYCDSVRQLVEEYDQTKTSEYETFSSSYIKNLLYANLALAYVSVGRTNEAADAMNMAIKYAEDDIMEDYLRMFNLLCSEYYYKKGEYRTALEYVEKNERLAASSTRESGGYEMLMKSKILAAMGNYEGAYKIECDYRERTDSLYQKKLSQRISELHTIHQIEKLEFQAEQQQLKDINQRLYIIGLTVIISLLACVILIVIYNLNKIKRKNRILYQRIQSQETLEEELNRKEEELNSKSTSDDKTIDDEETDQLYLYLKKIMSEEKVFTDPNLTRKNLATKLGTNERYLYETIKKHLDLGFSDYINLLRIDYAKEIMIHNLNELSLEDIAMMSGFGTRQTFHRLFRDRYGLSPSEFSKLLKNS